MDVIETQASIIGAMLIEESVVGPLLGALDPEDFTQYPYRTVFVAARKLFGDGSPVDLVTLLETLKVDPSVIWPELLRQCMEITPTAANAMVYAKYLKEQSRLIRLRELANGFELAMSLDDAQALLEKMNALQVVRSGVKVTTMERGFADFMTRHDPKAVPPKYLPWGFSELDSRLYVGEGQFVVIGGYPSHGKTAFALQAAWAMARDVRVGFYSYETKDKLVMDRLMSRLATIAMGRIKHNHLTEEDFVSAADASEYITSRPFDIIEAAGMTVTDIFAHARSRRYGVIVIDYIQLIKPDHRAKSRTEEITNISIDLHTSIQGSGITVVGLSQLSRQSKDSRGKAPRMSDLRESGQLEQDADVIMLIYREDFDDPDSRRVLAVEKNKEGETGKIYLDFNGSTQTFTKSRRPPPKKRTNKKQDTAPEAEEEMSEVDPEDGDDNGEQLTLADDDDDEPLPESWGKK